MTTEREALRAELAAMPPGTPAGRHSARVTALENNIEGAKALATLVALGVPGTLVNPICIHLQQALLTELERISHDR